jgi:hypothetical protein
MRGFEYTRLQTRRGHSTFGEPNLSSYVRSEIVALDWRQSRSERNQA